MSKWIAEFDLEDGDTMPEHMDLYFNGRIIDCHCRPMWIPVSERLHRNPMSLSYGKVRNNMWKYPSYEVIKRELPCVMCENWDERIHECSLHYGYTGDSECNKRKAERGECQ